MITTTGAANDVQTQNTTFVTAITNKINQINIGTLKINYKNCIDVYRKIFTDVINTSPFKYDAKSNIDTYRSLWDLYLKDKSSQQNLFNIQKVLTEFQLDTLTKYNNKIDDVLTFKTKIELVRDFNQNIMYRFALDYETLPLEYNDTNYALKLIMDTIAHSIEHNVCTMLYIAISKALNEYIVNSIERPINMMDDEYANYVLGIVDNIMSAGTRDTSMFLKYIMNTLPIKAVKMMTSVYDGDDDPDRKDIKIISLFEPINSMLMIEKPVPIDKSSSVYVLLNTTIYPYFADILENFVKEAKNMTDSYMHYLINENKQLEIIVQCADKAARENK